MPGKIKTNSTSKIKNRIASKKKRTANGKRGNALQLKPHSKGLIFSWSKANFFIKIEPAPNTSKDITKEIIIMVNKIVSQSNYYHLYNKFLIEELLIRNSLLN